MDMSTNTQITSEANGTPKPKRRLDDIVEDYINELIAGQGECTLRLDELDEEIEDKGLAYQYAGKKIDAAIEGQRAQKNFFEKEAGKHAARMTSLERERERLKERLAKGMRISGKTEFRTVLGKIYFQKHPVVKVADDWAERAYQASEALAEKYVNRKVSYEAKRQTLLATFKDMLKDYKKNLPSTPAGEDRAWLMAVEQMPEGVVIEPNEKLHGV